MSEGRAALEGKLATLQQSLEGEAMEKVQVVEARDRLEAAVETGKVQYEALVKTVEQWVAWRLQVLLFVNGQTPNPKP